MRLEELHGDSFAEVTWREVEELFKDSTSGYE